MATEHPVALSCAPGAFWSPDDDSELVCIDVRAETHDVKTFVFRARDERYFGVEAGQHFSFELEVDGEALSRCYSITSSALAPRTISTRSTPDTASVASQSSSWRMAWPV